MQNVLLFLKMALNRHYSSIQFSYTFKDLFDSKKEDSDCNLCPIQIQRAWVHATEKWFKIRVIGSEIEIFYDNKLVTRKRTKCSPVKLEGWDDGETF